MASSGEYRYLFGPVRSRRMGRSLGIDLVPSKTCTYDCPYCQAGRTSLRTIERRPYVPTVEVLAEFDRWLATGEQADYITLSGSGEPTLHSEFGEILAGIAARTPIRRALLSNGSLFSQSAVRAAACRAHVVKSSLSAWDQASFEAAHRPHPSLTFGVFLQGLRDLRAEFAGEFWIEVFLMAGRNDALAQVARIADLANSLGANRIQLNTVVRPPADSEAQAVAASALDSLAKLFRPVAETLTGSTAVPHHAPTDSAACQRAASAPDDDTALARTILDVVRRHPSPAADLAAELRIDAQRLATVLADMERRNVIRSEQRGATRYYGPA